MTPEDLVDKAKTGSRAALEELVETIQHDVYRLAMRMLWHPHDAEDATQEILIRIVTNLASFRGDSTFRTWTYRVASNYLLTTRKRRMEQRQVSFDEFGADLVDGLSDGLLDEYTEAEQNVLIKEVKIGCSQAMLLCLDRDHRLAYILGEIMDFKSGEGAVVLNVTPIAFRKRLSRSRKRISQFMEGHCGLVNSAAMCRCRKRVKRAVGLGRIDTGKLLFAEHPSSERAAGDPEQQVQEIDKLRRSVAVLRSNPEYEAPGELLQSVRRLLQL